MKNNKKKHPIVKTNYIPRIIASSFFVLYAMSMVDVKILESQVIWLILLGLVWPHIARFKSNILNESKNNEVLNMHIDAAFSACFILALPTLEFMVIVAAILVSNGLFIGFFGLLFSLMLTAIFVLLFGHLTFFPITLMEANDSVKLLTSGFIIFYFGTFAAMGYKMTGHMIRLNKKIRAMSITDNLTQSYNRHYLEKSLARELQRSQRMNYPLCVLFADLDYFKAVNDNYGHEAGDELLRSFVDLVKLSIRTEVDWVARYGGEEFIIVLPNSTIDNGVQVAERIRKKLVETKLTIDNTEIQTTCSFGVASNEHFSSLCDFSVLINLADRALYEAKDSGRNCVKIAEPARDNKKAT